MREGEDDVPVFASAYMTWDKRNEILLEQAFETKGWLASSPKSDYANAFGLEYPFGPDMADGVTLEGIGRDVAAKVDRLRRVIETLEAYGNPTADGGMSPALKGRWAPPSLSCMVGQVLRASKSSC